MARVSSDKNDNEHWLPAGPQQNETLSRSIAPSPPDDQLGANNDSEIIQKINYAPVGGLGTVRLRIALQLELWVAVVSRWLISERDSGTLFLWQPVFLGLGCLLYFNLPREPLAWAFPVLATSCFLLVWKLGRQRLVSFVLIALGLVAVGSSLAQWRVARLDTQMLTHSLVAKFSGRVVAREQRTKGRIRYRIEITKGAITSRKAKDFAGLIQVTARPGGPQIAIGDTISGRARLAPPSGPAYPGGYSFAFQSWFRGVGASGFFFGKPQLVRRGAVDTVAMRLTQVRFNMAQIIQKALPGRNGALATALIVGDRSGIDEPTAEALRLSGLAHILAISGLHMALVAATVITLFRGIFASFPPLVLHNPIRKWAAGFALAAASIYLLISGASVATQRAYIMVAIMLLAVMLDHRALTMRNVAIAALIVLAISPEAILLPGFQMSFAAVAALVATYEALAKRAQRRRANKTQIQHSWVRRFVVRDIGGLALTSIVAGAATGIFAAYHFHRVALFGLLGNLLAMPIVSLVVMPLALLSVLAMPFGLEAGPLWAMSWGIDGVIMAAKFVADLGPQGATGLIPTGAMVLGSSGLLLLCLLKSKLRFSGLLCFVLAALLLNERELPDVVVLENGGQIGLVIAGEPMALSRPRAEKFNTSIWQRALAPTATSKENSVQYFKCDKFGCVGKIKGFQIAHTRSHLGLRADCQLADVLVLQIWAKNACAFMSKEKRPLIIDRATLANLGAHGLWIRQGKISQQEKDNGSEINQRSNRSIRVETAFGEYSRPWTRHRYPMSQ